MQHRARLARERKGERALHQFIRTASAPRKLHILNVVRAPIARQRHDPQIDFAGPGALTPNYDIGGGAFEAMVIVDAKALLAASSTSPELKRYTFTEHGDDALGMACGGTAEVLLEPTGPKERLIVFGAGVLLVPRLPLVYVAVLSQVANGVVLPLVLIFMLMLTNDRELMGEHVNTRGFNIVAWTTVVVMTVLTILMVLTQR